jgi:hypothetical protein
MSASEDPSGGGRGRRLRQAPGRWRTGLPQHDLSALGRVVVQQRVEIGPEATPVKLTRPGEEIIYVLEGRWRIRSRASRRGRATPVTS